MGRGILTSVAVSISLVTLWTAAARAESLLFQPRLVLAQAALADSAALDTAARAPAKAAKARPAKKPAEKKRMALAGSFDLELIYDDNVFRYSPENLLEFRQGLNPEKFNLDTYDDFVVSPRLQFSLGRRLIGAYETNILARYTLWQYTSNPDKTNESIWLRLRQPVSRSAFFEAAYTHAPLAYIRELTDRAPFDPRSTTALEWMAFRSTRHAFTLAYQMRLSSRLLARLEGGRTIRYYNRPFMENDNWEWNAEASGWFTLTKSWRVSGRYMYSDTEARALDTVGEERASSDDGDPSYERDLYELGLRFRPPRAIWLFRHCEVSGQYQAYFFTGDQPYHLDPIHTGRKDEVWVAEVGATSAPVWREVTLDLGYRHTERSSSSTASSIGADSIEEDKNYEDNRVWMHFSYPF